MERLASPTVALEDLSNSMAEGEHAGISLMRLSDARALVCNGCGDCCDSRRTDGYWTWGSLPADGYASQTGGVPLIIPLVKVNGAWEDREVGPDDLSDLGGTRFHCSAFAETPPTVELPGGGGTCTRHDGWRPPACDEFPVRGRQIEEELAASGEVPLETGAFPRCTWYRITVVRDDDPRLA